MSIGGSTSGPRRKVRRAGGTDGGPKLPGSRHDFAEANGVRLHYVEQGDGPVVLLLHGFPDFWYSWRFQLPALAAAGFRAIAVDLRGYGESSRPGGVGSYAVPIIAADLTAFAAALGISRLALAGHDWGGVIAWHIAARHPDLVQRLIVLNAPHSAALRREMTSSLQPLRSWYVGFFQLPWLPEAVLGAFNGALLVRTLRNETHRAGAFTDDDAAAYRAVLGGRDALRAPIHYYRALFRGGRRAGKALKDTHAEPGGRRGRSARQVLAPTLLLWGDRDPHLTRGLTSRLDRWVPNLRVRHFPDAGHWVHWDAATEVNRSIVAFLNEAPGR
jgi:epoxide hydrolase 4